MVASTRCSSDELNDDDSVRMTSEVGIILAVDEEATETRVNGEVIEPFQEELDDDDNDERESDIVRVKLDDAEANGSRGGGGFWR